MDDHLARVLKSITETASSDKECCISIHNYIRDNIKFRFTIDFDKVSPNHTSLTRQGHCNPQADLFRELSSRAGFPSRLNFVYIDKNILRYAVPAVIYLLLPKRLYHAVTDVYINNGWQSVDSYIFDRITFDRQQTKLLDTDLSCGFGLRRTSICEWRADGDALCQASDEDLIGSNNKFENLAQSVMEDAGSNKCCGIHINKWLGLIPHPLKSSYELYINRLLHNKIDTHS